MGLTITDFFHNAWRWKCGLPEKTTTIYPDLDTLKKSEWSVHFEQLMRNRLIMGAMRYGGIHAKGKPKYDRVASINRRLKQYQSTGNKEILVDVANMCLLEFEECDHTNAHFHAIDNATHPDEK